MSKYPLQYIMSKRKGLNIMKQPVIIFFTIIILSATAGTSPLSGTETIEKEVNAWFRYHITAGFNEEGLAVFALAGSRYNFNRSIKIDGADQPAPSKNACLQEVSAGLIVPLYSRWNISLKGLIAYSPHFYFIDEKAGGFYTRHNLETQLELTAQFHDSWAWYRLFMNNALPGKDGEGTDLDYQFMTRHQAGFAFPVTSWLIPMIDNEIFINLTPESSRGEKYFCRNISTGTLRFKAAVKLAFDLKYSFAWILAGDTGSDETIIHRHYISLWVHHFI